MESAIEPLLTLLGRLPDQFRELRDGVRRAVDIARVDPEMGLARSRKVLELLVRDVFERRVGEPPGTRPLENLLQRLVKDGHWPARLEAYATTVRMLGNVGVHRFGEEVTATDVFHSLAQFAPILDWYFAVEHPNAVAAEESRPAEKRPAATAPPASGWVRLCALAKPTDRIWPLRVESRARDASAVSYGLSDLRPQVAGNRPQLPLGSRVFWAVRWDSEAHLLLLDRGPEEETFCLCPSWFVPDTRLRPGVSLLPPESARCEPFVVTGVPGREQLVAILSDRPPCADWMPPDRAKPARVLSEDDFDRLLARLQRLEPGSWSALTVSCEITV